MKTSFFWGRVLINILTLKDLNDPKYSSVLKMILFFFPYHLEKIFPCLQSGSCHTLRLLTPPMETPDPPNDTPGALKQVVLTPHDIPWSFRVKNMFLPLPSTSADGTWETERHGLLFFVGAEALGKWSPCLEEIVDLVLSREKGATYIDCTWGCPGMEVRSNSLVLRWVVIPRYPIYK